MQGSTNFHGRFIHTGVISSSRMSQSQLICSTPHYTVRFFSIHLKVMMLTLMKVRYLNGSALASTMPHVPPFIVFGRDCSVFLETFKRGDLDDTKGIRTVVLRLYEAYGGHASICLQVNTPQRVIAAYETNLLEDDVGAGSLAMERTTGEWGERPGEQMLRLVFRGFEVKTIKVVLAKDA
jgi:Glycosyl hydrolases family 38 C-terminal beta sandwich domain